MSSRNKVSTNIETSKTDLETIIDMRPYEINSEIKADTTKTFRSLDIKKSGLTSNKPSSS